MIIQHIRGWLDAGHSSAMLAMAKGDPAAIDCETVRAAAVALNPLVT
jgi:hypothetical protein